MAFALLPHNCCRRRCCRCCCCVSECAPNTWQRGFHVFSFSLACAASSLVRLCVRFGCAASRRAAKSHTHTSRRQLAALSLARCSRRRLCCCFCCCSRSLARCCALPSAATLHCHRRRRRPASLCRCRCRRRRWKQILSERAPAASVFPQPPLRMSLRVLCRRE